MNPVAYELLDFGAGRKLERFGGVSLDRPCPAAESIECRHVELWRAATARFERTGRDAGRWHSPTLPRFDEPWSIDCDGFQLQLRPTPFGHVGMFPEQLANWAWIARQLARRAEAPRVLNLFAYTGGSTLAAAAAGAEVVHVDAARNVVQWARENAQGSGFAQAPIRWMVEDAHRFVQRELRRGQRYDAIILDPPSYGKGPKGETWKLTVDLAPLLQNCRLLLSEQPAFILLTCHSSGFGPAEVAATLQQSILGRCSSQVDAQPLQIPTTDGRRLAAGVVARWRP